MHYFIGKDGKQLGPFEAEQVRAQLDAGLISPTDLLWREGMPDWAPVSSEFPPSPPPAPTPGTTVAAPAPAPRFPAATPRAQAGNPFVFNPAPETSAEPVLADRGKRFLARLIDGGLMLCAITPGMIWLFSAIGAMGPHRSYAGNHPGVEPEAAAQALMAVGGGFLLTTVLALGLFIVQVVMLSTKGQTVGKKMLGIRVVRQNGDEAGFVHAVILRTVLMCFINSLTGGVTALVDPLCIFRDDRRCFHDMIAGTMVIDA